MDGEGTINDLAVFIHETIDVPHIRSQINITDLTWTIATPLWDAGWRCVGDSED